jgi:hypothetical protein
MSKKKAPLEEATEEQFDMSFEDAGLPLEAGVVSPEDVPQHAPVVHADNCMHSHTDKINGFCKHK